MNKICGKCNKKCYCLPLPAPHEPCMVVTARWGLWGLFPYSPGICDSLPFSSPSHALPDFRYCSVCPVVWQLCPAGHREGQKTVHKFQSLAVNPASVSMSASFHTTGLKWLLSKQYTYLWTMHIAFETGTGKETGTKRDHFDRDSGVQPVHMDHSCTNTQKNSNYSSPGTQQIWCW